MCPYLPSYSDAFERVSIVGQFYFTGVFILLSIPLVIVAGLMATIYPIQIWPNYNNIIKEKRKFFSFKKGNVLFQL